MTNNEIKNITTRLEKFKSTLEDKIKNCKQVFITAHNHIDLDGLAAALGIALIAKKYKKKCYIIMEKELESNNNQILSIIDNIADDFEIINNDIYDQIKSHNDTLIVVDTNSKYQICCSKHLDSFKNIVIIDHHVQSAKTIPTIHKFINPDLSSSSEIVCTLLQNFNIKYNNQIATYILAGIIIDTNKLTSKTTTKNTFRIVSKLLGKGANLTEAYELLDESYETRVRVDELIKETDFYNYNIAICCGANEDIYTQEELAKAANTLLSLKSKSGTVDISCAIGRIDKDTISISSRGNGTINISKIMELFGGGGDLFRGAAKVKNIDTISVKKELSKVLKPQYYINKENNNEEYQN